MPKYNVVFPIAGRLNFYDVEADNQRDAIDKCYELSSVSENHMEDFDGEWEMYEKISEGNVLHVSYSEVDVSVSRD